MLVISGCGFQVTGIQVYTEIYRWLVDNYHSNNLLRSLFMYLPTYQALVKEEFIYS